MTKDLFYYQCAVDVPINNSLLTYSTETPIAIGGVVEVPLGRRTTSAVAIKQIKDGELGLSKEKVRSIKGILNISYFQNEKYLLFYKTLSNYYHYPLGQLIHDALPEVPKKTAMPKRFVDRDQIDFELNSNQRAALNKIKEFGLNSFHKHLIYGVTGSGKSYVYAELIKSTIYSGKSVLLLLPEINLTHKFIEFYQEALGRLVEVYCYNSELSSAKKFALWEHSYVAETPALYIGARSAVFLPLTKLGLVIVDEEHDQSYKQTDRCPYWARDAASIRVKIENIPIVLGSATPSLESFYNCQKGISHLIELESRFGGQSLPHTQVIPMEYDREKKMSKPLSDQSIEILKEVKLRGEQAIIFINRLGFSNFMQCASCGHRFTCKNCDTSLRYFRQKAMLSCSHCDYQEIAPKSCPQCWCLDLKPIGIGTEQVVDYLNRHIPTAQTLRFDTEILTTSKKVEQALKDFSEEKACFLVGTQMIAKGHTFPKVNTVIALGVDQRLNTPDFRAFEHCFQMLQQVSGRAGRIKGQGKVYIESNNPELPFWDWVKEGSFSTFAETELAKRNDFLLPPFANIAQVLVFHKDRSICQSLITQLKEGIESRVSRNEQIKIIGPRPANLERKKNLFTWVLALTSVDRRVLHNVLSMVPPVTAQLNINNFKLDVDPIFEI